MPPASLPKLHELGPDLFNVPRWRLVASLVFPFAIAGTFFAAASSGIWVVALGCMVSLTFLTYGSISHDLVHRALGLRPWTNDILLLLVELLMLRSGRAYQLAHLNHHARFPDSHNDPEGRAAHGTFWGALRSGPFYCTGLWWWALRSHPRHRSRLLLEACLISTMVSGAIFAAMVGWSVVPLLYVLLAYLSTWAIPLVTSYIPHTPQGNSSLLQTRRFRGWLVRLIALDHLYHLEHHLYPAVPHHRWRQLADCLDPFLDQAAVPIVRLGR
jgi:beta-carotene hydroxylase